MAPGSSIINTASVNADKPNARLVAYAATQGAIQNLSGGMAQRYPRELRRPGTDLDALDPLDFA
jgi:NAD(P)-dependent dehydrogenase (short-subunit alcohol dehydrogenase family)